YLTDTTNEAVTIDTVNQGGFATTACTVFCLHTVGHILASDSSQAIQAPTIMLVSTNGSISFSGTTPLSISNTSGGVPSNISLLYASAPTGNVYLTDATNETVTLSTAATSGTSTANSVFSLSAQNSIFQDTVGSTSINSPTVILAAANGGTIGPLN